MNWGLKIVLSFVVFIGVITTLVYISMNQDVSLVAEDYYEQEIAYEEQIQRIKNSQELEEPLEFKVEGKKAKITYPETLRALFKEGTVHFFRPSESRLDQEFLMLPRKSNYQEIELKDFKPGLWKVKINWRSAEKEYYKEISIVL